MVKKLLPQVFLWQKYSPRNTATNTTLHMKNPDAKTPGFLDCLKTITRG